MVWHGHIENGTVIVDGDGSLPDGRRVRIELLPSDANGESTEAQGTLGSRLLELAGKAKGLPTDAASRHDDYLARPDSL